MITIRKARSQGDRQAQTQAESRVVTMQAPVRGWIDATVMGDGMTEPENVFPTERGIRVRGGSYRVANCAAPVLSMFAYETATVSRLFAATATDIFNVTALDPGATLTADVAGQGAGYWSTAQIGTAGGEYLTAVNGVDSPQQFDGSTWSVPSITGASGPFSYIWIHKNRYWFIEASTKRAWYLPVDSIAGAALDFSLAGVFQAGGKLLFGATWSQDSGSGMDDRQVFVSDEGEVAVYEGSNPSDANAWGLVGVYKMAPPLGPKAHMKAGGDLLIATGDGLVSLSAVVSKDPAALSATAVSAPIEPSWRLRYREYVQTSPWEVVKWPKEGMMLVSCPSARDEVLVANIITGAWSRYTGWDVDCMSQFGSEMYFGASDGYVYQAERGGSDNGDGYVCQWMFQPNDMQAPGSFKTVGAVKATFTAARDYSAKLTVAADYATGFPPSPNPAVEASTDAALFDTGLWDTSRWDGAGDAYYTRPTSNTGWVSQGVVGDVVAPRVQIASDGTRRPDAEFLRMEVLYSVGSPL